MRNSQYLYVVKTELNALFLYISLRMIENKKRESRLLTTKSSIAYVDVTDKCVRCFFLLSYRIGKKRGVCEYNKIFYFV